MTSAAAQDPRHTASPRPGGGDRGRRFERLIEFSRAIGTHRDEDELLRAIVLPLTAALGAERATLYLHDAGRHELWTVCAPGPEAAGELRVPDDHGLCGRVHQTRQSLCIEDVHEHPDFARRIASRTGYLPRSILLTPVLHACGRSQGVVQVMDRRAGHFSDADLPLIEAIAGQIAIALEHARQHAAQRRQFSSFVRAVSTALDARDPLTAIHSVNVANYAMGIGQILGLPPEDVEWLRMGGLLHDIGKIGVSEAVLTKGGRLTGDEYEEMKRHAGLSREILRQIDFTEEFRGMERIAAAHHERLDGSGYPDGLRGEAIPLKGRILAVADVYDALTQTRHYRRGVDMHEALRTMDAMTPHQLDARCVGALKAFLGRGPWPMR